MGDIKTILADLGVLAALTYCAGRWYKEHYFSSFGVSWEMIEREHSYFLFGGWFTLMVAAALLLPCITAWADYRAGAHIRSWFLLGVPILIVLGGAFWAWRNPARKGDIVSVLLVLALNGVFLLVFPTSRRELAAWCEGQKRIDMLLAVLGSFVFLYVVAFGVGKLHAQVAKDRGWLPTVALTDAARTRLKVDTETTARFLTRIDKERNILLFEPGTSGTANSEKRKTATVSDAEIAGVE